MGNLSMHFCENTKKPFDCCPRSSFKLENCVCCCSGKPSGNANDSPVTFDQVVLFPTDYDCVEWVGMYDLPFTSTTVFFKDPDGRIRTLVHHEPHERAHRLSRAEQKREGPLECDANIGQLVEDILPKSLCLPLLKLMNGTINEGGYYQANMLFNGTSKLIRTFPLPDPDQNIIAGVMLIGMFTQNYDNTLKKYVLNPKKILPPPLSEEEQTRRRSIDEQLDKIPQIKHMAKFTKAPKGNTL